MYEAAPAGPFVPRPFGYALTGPGGQVVVFEFGLSSTWISATGNWDTPITAGKSIWIDEGSFDPHGTGVSLLVDGIHAFSGTLTVGLP